ncbi:MAG TPA: glycosyltransferase [Oligoflexia bacterium]|nr:glycosyltransferase [Oligoflexia bacterium]HMP26848.1 glycosyltransferase [Oligoflexia bacterium]
MQRNPKISIIIPARNEEKYLPKCLAAIEAAKKNTAADFEIIVVANRCTDKTEQIALKNNCLVIKNESKNLAQIRNAGAATASGDIIVTVDADSFVSKEIFRDILKKLSSPRIIGGGVWIWPERLSLGIFLTGLCLLPLIVIYGISAGLFFVRRQDFFAIGGFNEELVSVEDVDFAKRLKAHGEKSRRKFVTLFRSYIVTSCRKFDRFGDWYFLKNPREFKKIFEGRDRDLANKIWYDFEH